MVIGKTLKNKILFPGLVCLASAFLIYSGLKERVMRQEKTVQKSIVCSDYRNIEGLLERVNGNIALITTNGPDYQKNYEREKALCVAEYFLEKRFANYSHSRFDLSNVYLMMYCDSSEMDSLKHKYVAPNLIVLPIANKKNDITYTEIHNVLDSINGQKMPIDAAYLVQIFSKGRQLICAQAVNSLKLNFPVGMILYRTEIPRIESINSSKKVLYSPIFQIDVELSKITGESYLTHFINTNIFSNVRSLSYSIDGWF